MPKPRPGVDASFRLSKISDLSIWMAIDKQYGDMLLQKGGTKLLDLDKACEEISLKWQTKTQQQQQQDVYCTCEDLYTIMEWKFATGKPRPLWKHIKSNSEETLRKVSKDAFAMIRHVQAHDDDDDVDVVIGNALEALSKLKGIGPASASAILSLYRPDLLVFMYDEILDCFLGERKYTADAYKKINIICRDLVKDIGGTTGSALINVRKLGQILWSAARISLCKDKVDLTLGSIPCQEERTDDKLKKNKGDGVVEQNVKRNADKNLIMNVSDNKESCDDQERSLVIKSAKRRKTERRS